MRSAPRAASMRAIASDSAVSPLRETEASRAPCSATSPASSRELESGMAPAGSSWPGSTSSAPVDTTATRGLGKARTADRPTEAREATAVAVMKVPAVRTESPMPTSSPAWRTLRPGLAATRIPTSAGGG